ncbi:class I SAM-dependent methyltransferase [Streptomyces griseoloalbus]|uniref:SAM-dependent methyltransferase n=1 Tax=Streptomyces griseoloalbus TaxID=67303 RepID=A0A7W8BXZ8_9ACTN|nr:class I SAM-dependent methyltransferase [Streptomyces albaduncus]MBB5130288.1 SAM-dependent methyltransferase [Streptomyces albaduncus]GGW82140.1 methyltransferase type 11 [Streptomyces albaduncus]
MHEQPQPHPAFEADYDRFWRRYRSESAEVQELDTIEKLGELAPGMRVLDLACGFGRIANGLAARGCTVVGIDSSKHLLDIARQEGDPATTYLLGDMRNPQVDEDFDVVLVWSTSLGYYGEKDDEATLSAALRALKPGGRLLVESRHWDRFGRTFDSFTEKSHGDDVLREWHSYDPLLGRQLTEQEVVVEGRSTRRSYHVRRYGIPELRSLVLRLGYDEVSAHDERGQPLTPTSERAVLRARRPLAGDERQD